MRFVVITFLVPILALLASVRAAPSLGVRWPRCNDDPEKLPLHLVFMPPEGHREPMHIGEEYTVHFDIVWCYGTGPFKVHFSLTELLMNGKFLSHPIQTINLNPSDQESGQFKFTPQVHADTYLMEYAYWMNGKKFDHASTLYTVV